MDNEHIKVDHTKGPKFPVVLLLDTSSSMAGEKINSLNSGVNLLINTLNKDDVPFKWMEFCIVSFNTNVDVIQDFAVVDDMPVVNLNASGSTSMGEAILKGIDLISKRKAAYKSSGIDYYRPWIWLITDGEPTDYSETMRNNVIKSVHDGENNHNFVFFAVGVEGADMQTLSEISVREPFKLNQINFEDMFAFHTCPSLSNYGENDHILISPPDWKNINSK